MSVAVPTPLRAPRRALGVRLALAPLVVVLVVSAIMAIGAGAIELSMGQVIGILLERVGLASPWAFDAQQAAVLWAIRLPRVIAAVLIGGVLAASGAAMQGLFRNPLADPALLGVSSGASLGAVAAIGLVPVVLGPLAAGALGTWSLPVLAFLGALAATWLSLRVGRVEGRPHTALMLLAGVAINAVAGAGLGLAMHLGSDAQLRSLTFWTLGSLGGATWLLLAAATPLLLLSVASLLSVARPLNAMLLGEREARHLGVNVTRVQRTVVLATALGVGASVAVAGIIGFVGLVVPHLARTLLGPDHRRLIPASALAGASLLCLADVISRTVSAPSELPLGVVTAILGAPLFLWQLMKSARAGELR